MGSINRTSIYTTHTHTHTHTHLRRGFIKRCSEVARGVQFPPGGFRITISFQRDVQGVGPCLQHGGHGLEGVEEVDLLYVCMCVCVCVCVCKLLFPRKGRLNTLHRR
jgi:hypothetical protein